MIEWTGCYHFGLLTNVSRERVIMEADMCRIVLVLHQEVSTDNKLLELNSSRSDEVNH